MIHGENKRYRRKKRKKRKGIFSCSRRQDAKQQRTKTIWYLVVFNQGHKTQRKKLNSALLFSVELNCQ